MSPLAPLAPLLSFVVRRQRTSPNGNRRGTNPTRYHAVGSAPAGHDGPGRPNPRGGDFLVVESPYELLRWVGVNEFLHAADNWNRWPPFLVAFASNGCGDYFAYDIRTEPAKII